MKETLTQQVTRYVAETAAKAAVGFKSGEFNTTRVKMNTSTEIYGYIASALTVNKTLYIIAYREVAADQDARDHGIRQYFNCDGDFTKMSPYELLMPVMNIDLSRDVIDPRSFIGQRVIVSEINGQAMQAVYIGELDELNQSPLMITRTLLKSARNWIGGYTTLHDKDTRVRQIMEQLGLGEVVDKMYETPVEDWLGNVVSFEQEGKYTNDTSNPKEGEIVIKSVEGYTRNLNQEGMKSKNCHLPVKLFSAR